MLELIGLGLIALVAVSLSVELIMRFKSRRTPRPGEHDARRRRAAERLLAERLIDRHDHRR